MNNNEFKKNDKLELDTTGDIARLKWSCRRGMLELDVLLGNFLKNHYPRLSSNYQMAFAEFLKRPDPELFSWLMGYEKPTEDAFLHLVEMIRKHESNP